MNWFYDLAKVSTHSCDFQRHGYQIGCAQFTAKCVRLLKQPAKWSKPENMYKLKKLLLASI